MILHLYRPQLFDARMEQMLSTPWGRAKLATNEALWEIQSARIVYDPQGLLSRARIRSREFFVSQAARMIRLKATQLQLRTLSRRLSGLGGTASREGRNRAAIPVATGILSLGGKGTSHGLCGLVQALLCQIGDSQPGRAGLWVGAKRAARGMRLCGGADPLHGMRYCQHMDVMRECADEAQLQTRLIPIAERAVDVAFSALSRRRPADCEETQRLVAYYRRLAAHDAETALVLLRGEMARELHSDPAYLAVCGIDLGENEGPADAWPELLARLSSALVAAQAVDTFIKRLTPELLDYAAAAKDCGDSCAPPL